MLELLCNDVVQIVYRYVFDWRYKILRNQYQVLWLGKREMYWNDKFSCFFRYGYGYVANYRPLWNVNQVCKVYDPKGYIGVADLPKNYI